MPTLKPSAAAKVGSKSYCFPVKTLTRIGKPTHTIARIIEIIEFTAKKDIIACAMLLVTMIIVSKGNIVSVLRSFFDCFRLKILLFSSQNGNEKSQDNIVYLPRNSHCGHLYSETLLRSTVYGYPWGLMSRNCFFPIVP